MLQQILPHRLFWIAVLSTLWVLPLPSPVVGQSYIFQAESGSLVGLNVAYSVPGYTGSGYVTGFDNSADRLNLSVSVPAGLYELWIRYNSPYGKKGYDFTVAGESGQGWFNGTSSNAWAWDRAGLFRLSGSSDLLQIRPGWGYYNIDALELRPSSVRPIAAVSAQLVNPNADSAARWLMSYLASLYGSKTLAGQQGLVGQDVPFPSAEYLTRSGGLVPAVRGSDLIEYSPSRIERGSNPNFETERLISWARRTGGIVTLCWHWNAPTGLIDQPGKEWWRGFYTYATTFDLQAALANPESLEYQLLLRDIDAIAAELTKFRNAGVPVLWRPLHEAQGGWFWWGAKGPGPFVQLWRLMYDRMTNLHGLNNLIWVFTSSSAEENHLDWYPGDDVVDIVGIDVYTDRTSSMSGQWLDLLDTYNGRKIITLSETGYLPDPNLLRDRGVRWSWFCPWSVSDVVNNYTAAQLQAVLSDADIVTLDELPVTPWTTLLGDTNYDGVVDLADYNNVVNNLGHTGWLVLGDTNFDNLVDLADYNNVVNNLGRSANSHLAVPEPASWFAGGFLSVILLAYRTARRHLVL